MPLQGQGSIHWLKEDPENNLEGQGPEKSGLPDFPDSQKFKHDQSGRIDTCCNYMELLKMDGTDEYPVKDKDPHWFYLLCLLAGATSMVIAGYFLVIGLSKFGGDETTRTILAGGAVLFQVVETLCFVGAAGFAFHSRRWQISLFALGSVLFIFSLFVMTLAQKTAMQTGEIQAEIIDSQVAHIEKQIASYDKLIGSYQFNAEKQSRSIYKDSRLMGQDSLNKAAGFEEKKMALADELVDIKSRRQQTSMDFFDKLGVMTGYDAADLEWTFMIGRSLLFELCGIILLAFGVSHRAGIKRYQKDSGGKGGSDIGSAPVPGMGKRLRDFIDTSKIPILTMSANSAAGRKPPARLSADTAGTGTKSGSLPGTKKHVPGRRKTIPGTKKPVPARKKKAGGTNSSVPAQTGSVPVQLSPKVINLDHSRKRLLLDDLEPRVEELMYKAISAFERNDFKKLNRENVRKALGIKTRDAGIVTKAAKLYIKYSDTALER